MTDAPFQIEQVGPGFAARVTGIDLREPLAAESVQALEAAIWDHGVLVFPGQHLEQEQQVAFTEQFGELYCGVQMKLLKEQNARMRHPALSEISNIGKDGEPVGPGYAMANIAVGTWQWHSDAVYEDRPFRYSVLSSQVAVSWGGQTQFADMRAAWDALDPRLQALVEGREATFYSHHNRHCLGLGDAAKWLRTHPPVRWPMVRRHPGSGRKVLWVDTRVIEISGMTVPEGRTLAADLVEHATQRERVYSHDWVTGDVIMYDNRSVLHRARRYDFNEPRHMRRVATIDDSRALGQGDWPDYVLPAPGEGESPE
ncbi:MAG: TauD/TfdA family dioxygenase [Sphingomonadaceae bacterium]